MTNGKTLDDFIIGQRKAENIENLPLSNVRVIDLSTVVAAPFAAALLGDMGADVIKIENPAVPDAVRSWGVIKEKEIHPFWSVIGRNKYPITLNLKSSEAKEIFEKLVQKSDILIENIRPGTMDNLGFDVESLLKVNPGLIIGKMSGYGQTGPSASRPGFGTLAEGYSGYTYLNAHPDGIPTNPPMALADYIAGLHLAFAIMIALRDQKRGGKGGQVIDVSLYEPLFSMLGPDYLSYVLTGDIPQPKGNELAYTAPRNSYQTKDSQWVALSCSAQKPFERLMDTIGHSEMKKDPRYQTNDSRIKQENRKTLNRVIEEWIADQNLEEVLDTCDKLGITIGPVASMKDIDEDRHYRERGSIIEIDDPVTGTPLKIPNLPFRMLDTPGRIRFPGLPQGAANSVILRNLLGYSTEDIERFKANSII